MKVYPIITFALVTLYPWSALGQGKRGGGGRRGQNGPNPMMISILQRECKMAKVTPEGIEKLKENMLKLQTETGGIKISMTPEALDEYTAKLMDANKESGMSDADQSSSETCLKNLKNKFGNMAVAKGSRGNPRGSRKGGNKGGRFSEETTTAAESGASTTEEALPAEDASEADKA